MCGFFHSLVLIIMIGILHNTLEEWKNFDDNLVSTSFGIGSYFGSLMSSILFVKRVWFQRKRIIELLNTTKLPTTFIQEGSIKKRFLIVIIKIFVIAGIICLNMSNYFAALNTQMLKTISNLLCHKTISTILLTHVSTFYTITRLEMTIIATTLLIQKQIVATQLKLADENIHMGLTIYRNMKSKIEIINRVYGNPLVAYYLIVVGYYCGMPGFLLSSEFSQFPITILIYFGLDTVGWVLAAEFNYLIEQTFLKWHEHCIQKRSCVEEHTSFGLYKVCGKCDQMAKSLYLIQREQEISKFNNEFKLDSLALSCRLFQVNYSFLKAVSFMPNLDLIYIHKSIGFHQDGSVIFTFDLYRCLVSLSRTQ